MASYLENCRQQPTKLTIFFSRARKRCSQVQSGRATKISPLIISPVVHKRESIIIYFWERNRQPGQRNFAFVSIGFPVTLFTQSVHIAGNQQDSQLALMLYLYCYLSAFSQIILKFIKLYNIIYPMLLMRFTKVIFYFTNMLIYYLQRSYNCIIKYTGLRFICRSINCLNNPT